LPLASVPLAAARSIILLEGLSQADNVGGVFRNAAAFGVDAVVLGPRCCDPLYRKALRTSMGAALTVPFATASDWLSDVRRLHDDGFRIVALTPRVDAEPIDRVEQGPRDRVALLVGAEGAGLTDEALGAADVRARIPMAPGVDSLNVATATGIALHRLWRPV
jgi:tRNA G18 (ribose-2'-O)-methylase SpoU